MTKRNPKARHKRPSRPVWVGERFRFVTVLSDAGVDAIGQKLFRCVCQCGKEFTTRGTSLRNEHCKSCGCRISRKKYASRKEAKRADYWRHVEQNRIKSREWRIKNQEKARENDRKYRETKKNDPEHKARIREYQIRTRDQTRVRMRKYIRHRLKIDIQFRIRHLLRKRLAEAVKRNNKAGSAVRELGCTIAEFKAYIETKFKSGMTWENWGRHGWHLDHIKPLAAFDLTNHEQFIKACHYTNYQPLWSADNIRKGARVA